MFEKLAILFAIVAVVTLYLLYRQLMKTRAGFYLLQRGYHICGKTSMVYYHGYLGQSKPSGLDLIILVPGFTDDSEPAERTVFALTGENFFPDAALSLVVNANHNVTIRIWPLKSVKNPDQDDIEFVREKLTGWLLSRNLAWGKVEVEPKRQFGETHPRFDD